MRTLIIAIVTASTFGCATLTEDAMTPIALSFSDGSSGVCQLTNKRGAWAAELPTTVSIRKSDDALKYRCETEDGREAFGSIKSEMGAKIVASAVFLDLGITDAITDKHRKYADNYVIPIAKKTEQSDTSEDSGGTDQTAKRTDVYGELEKLNDLRERGLITDAEYESEKKKLLDRN